MAGRTPHTAHALYPGAQLPTVKAPLHQMVAREAAALGIELFVMDDGWFGSRNDDNSGLGDWQVNREKLPAQIHYLSKSSPLPGR